MSIYMYLLAKIGVDTAENEPEVEVSSIKYTCTSSVEPKPILRSSRVIVTKPSLLRRSSSPKRMTPRPAAAMDRRGVANFWQNFGKFSLVFGCIGADLCK